MTGARLKRQARVINSVANRCRLSMEEQSREDGEWRLVTAPNRECLGAKSLPPSLLLFDSCCFSREYRQELSP